MSKDSVKPAMPPELLADSLLYTHWYSDSLPVKPAQILRQMGFMTHIGPLSNQYLWEVQLQSGMNPVLQLNHKINDFDIPIIEAIALSHYLYFFKKDIDIILHGKKHFLEEKSWHRKFVLELMMPNYLVEFYLKQSSEMNNRKEKSDYLANIFHVPKILAWEKMAMIEPEELGFLNEFLNLPVSPLM